MHLVFILANGRDIFLSMVGFHHITDVFVWFTCIFSLQGPVMLGTGPPVPGTGGTMVTVSRVGLWTPTPIMMTITKEVTKLTTWKKGRDKQTACKT